MNPKVPRELVAAISSRSCVLFAGSGLTADGGGATWGQLVDYLKKKFDYKGPLTNEMEVMGDLCTIHGYEAVYQAVKERLKNVSIDGQLAFLTKMPWFAVFTTNYDLALEDALKANQNYQIRSVVTGNEFELTGWQSELLCVKLMGSIDVPLNRAGSMVLDLGDLERAKAERSRIFEMLTASAAKATFLFVGYSFDDEIVLEVLARLARDIGTGRPNTYFAVFKEPPTEEKRYLLSQHKVNVIVADLKEFSSRLHDEVIILDPADLTKKKARIGADIVVLDTRTVGQFLTRYDPVLVEDLESAVAPIVFLKGYTGSLNPFMLGWHHQRPQENEVVNSVVRSAQDNNPFSVVCIEGPPGSGRTFTMLASVTTLIRDHRAIAIRLNPLASDTFPNNAEMRVFLEEVKRACLARGVQAPSLTVFFAEFPLEGPAVLRIEQFASQYELPVVLLYEDVRSDLERLGIGSRIRASAISVDVDLTPDQKNSLAAYLRDAIRRHRLPEIEQNEIERIVKDEDRMLPIVYRILDPTRRSINSIVLAHMDELPSKEARLCVLMCALSTSNGVPVPFSILKNAIGRKLGRYIPFTDMFTIAEDEAKAFIRMWQDKRTNWLAALYHECIAEFISGIQGSAVNDELLIDLSSVANTKSKVDADFIRTLLIQKGVNAETLSPFTEAGLEQSLFALSNKDPSRPILHHLARFYLERDPSDERIESLLIRALAEPIERYALFERKENVLTTLAKYRWEKDKDVLGNAERNDPRIRAIIDLLDSAKTTSHPNVHPYDFHAKILRDLWKRKDETTRLALMGEAIEVLVDGLAVCSDDVDATQRLGQNLTYLLADMDYESAIVTAESMLENAGDGTGFYALARFESDRNRNAQKASVFLDKALSARSVPRDAIALKIEIVLDDNSPNYKSALGLADRVSTLIDGRSSWKLHYNLAVIYALNGKYGPAKEQFSLSRRKAPRYLERSIRLFWMEHGSRKTLSGRTDFLTSFEGRIICTSFEYSDDGLYFQPGSQAYATRLKPGLLVDFELGFSPRGPIAFDVRPCGMQASNKS